MQFDTRPRDGGGKINYMAHAKSYVMVRRPGCVPFIVSEKDWVALPLWTPSAAIRAAGENAK